MNRYRIRFLILALIVAVIGISFFADAPVENWVRRHQQLEWKNAARFASRYGAWQWLMAVCAVWLGVFWMRGNELWKRIVIVAMIACSVSGLAADGARSVIGRTRPAADAAQGWYGPRAGEKWLVAQWQYGSFPSGHTAAATALYATLLFANWRVGLLAAPLTIGIAASRIYLRAHHFSDVIAGAALGFIVAFLLWEKMIASRSRSS